MEAPVVHLFTPLKIRNIEFKNRIFVSPMCQYSSQEGLPNEWHFVHLGSRAVGGAGLVMVEATAVSPEGRISPQDSGLWNDTQAEAFRPLTRFLREQGAVPGVQLAHAGRKASVNVPWKRDQPLRPKEGAWLPMAPSAVPFSAGWPVPKEMSSADVLQVIAQFSETARRAVTAGFEVIELHMAHGYLMHEFLSPLSNHRGDIYGGTLENRMRFPLEVAQAVREVWPSDRPLFTRISATDWIEGGWDFEQSLVLCRKLRDLGVDLIDCSTGGNSPSAQIPVGPNYQVPFAEEIRKQVGITTGAVGMLTKPHQVEEILATGQADVVFMARELLRDPYWPLHAAQALNVDVEWPKQYARAKPRL